uniref:Putative secreted protein n=1 Tax=Ixodes ricinus TaxID=34613 RepID=A0A6B0UDQ5_IXORI
MTRSRYFSVMLMLATQSCRCLIRAPSTQVGWPLRMMFRVSRLVALSTWGPCPSWPTRRSISTASSWGTRSRRMSRLTRRPRGLPSNTLERSWEMRR